MPAKVKVRILAGRNLPVMDKSSDASDAFVEIKLGNTTYKTEVYRRSLNPFWNSEWFRFEVSDLELQDEPLQIRVMDYDTYSANDAIGKVYINLNPLIVNPGRSMSGWLPIYDTLHGIRGEINCSVKVNLFADSNRYRHSSCGMRFFFSDIPNGYKCDAVLGFVDELLVSDDPEYQWIDKIRTPRASNEARQTLFTKLSGEVQRKLGLKAEMFGGNAVIGYQQSFDLEGGSGIVCRGIGTAVILSKIGLSYEDAISSLLGDLPLASECNKQRCLELKRMDKHLTHSASVEPKLSPLKQPYSEISFSHFFSAKTKPVTSPLESTSKRLLFRRAESDLQNFEIRSSLSDDDEIPLDANEVDSSFNLSANLHILNSKSINLKHTIDSKDGNTERRASSNSIIKRIRQSNENLDRTLSNATRPLTSLIGLSKSFLSRKQYQNSASRRCFSQSVEIFNYVNETGPDTSGNKLSVPPTKSPDKPKIHSSASRNTDNNDRGQDRGNQNYLAPNNIHKQRNEKSQSNSIDDALSIIEEKMDDDEQMPIRTAPRSRLSSGSIPKSSRYMSRSREIDLEDKLDDITCQEEKNKSSVMMSTNPAEVPLKSLEPTLSLSNHADEEIIKVQLQAEEAVNMEQNCNNQQDKDQLSESKSNIAADGSELNDTIDSSTSPTKPTATCTNFSRSESNFSQHNQLNQAPSSSLEQSNLARQQQLSPHRNRQNSANSTNNFIKSVRAVKAQQQLLQNMIKNQNKNLLFSSNLKAKNAFAQPSRVHEREYPFVTMRRYPDNMVQCTGGVVSVHSVKLLDHIISDEESETRDIWWTEIRREIRSHARSLNCNTVLGYRETSKVLDDVCILSAYGTAAVLKPSNLLEDTSESSGRRERNPSPYFNFQQMEQQPINQHPAQSPVSPCRSHSLAQEMPTSSSRINQVTSLACSPPKHPTPSPVPSNVSNNNENSPSHVANNLNINGPLSDHQKSMDGDDMQVIDCSFCHTPLTCVETLRSMPDCNVCRSHKVANILLMTIEPPRNLNIMSTGSLVQARVCRSKRDSHGEACAKEIGDALPFLEYELHRQLFVKLKFKGMNCLFNLTVDISVGEYMLTAVATGTGCFVLDLPMPEPPRVSLGFKMGVERGDLSRAEHIQSLISLNSQRNRDKLDWDKINAQLDICKRRFQKQQSLVNEDAMLNRLSVNEDKIPNESESTVELSGPTLVCSSSIPSSELSYNNAPQFYQSNLLDLAQPSGSSQQPRQNHYRHHHRLHHHRKHRRHHHRHQNHHQDRHLENRDTSLNKTEDASQALLTDNNNIVLDVDDKEDTDIVALLVDNEIPVGYFLCNSESLPGLNQSSITSINMFTQVMRVKIPEIDQFARQFDWVLQSLFVKLRRSLPCCLSNVRFVVDLPESSVIQITVTGCLLSLSNDLTQPTDSIYCHDNNLNKQISIVHQRSPSTSISSSSSSSSTTISENENSQPSNISYTHNSTYKSIPKLDKEVEESASQPSELSKSSGTNTPKEVPSLLPKPSSKTNLAAFFAMGTQLASDMRNKNKNKMTVESVEMTSGSQEKRELIKQQASRMEQKCRLESSGSLSLFRPVFKKQQTYPGANSPQISGQDQLLPSCPPLSFSNGTSSGASTTTAAPTNSTITGGTPTNRTTSILNKVKQPLRDLGSNINSSASLAIKQTSKQIGNNISSEAAESANSQQLLTRTSKHQHQQPAHQLSASEYIIEAVDEAVGMRNAPSTSPGVSAIGQLSGHPASLAPELGRKMNTSIDITSLSYIPGAREYQYLGNLSFSFVRETSSVRESGGLNGFIQCFLMEVYAIVRAHVSALRGNAFLSFRLQQSCILDHSNKNQAQCLISVAGDATQVSF